MATKFKRAKCDVCGTKLVVWKLIYATDNHGNIKVKLCYECSRKLQQTFNEIDIRFWPDKRSRLERAKRLIEERKVDEWNKLRINND